MFLLVCSFQKYKPCLHNSDFDTFDHFEQGVLLSFTIAVTSALFTLVEFYLCARASRRVGEQLFFLYTQEIPNIQRHHHHPKDKLFCLNSFYLSSKINDFYRETKQAPNLLGHPVASFSVA